MSAVVDDRWRVPTTPLAPRTSNSTSSVETDFTSPIAGAYQNTVVVRVVATLPVSTPSVIAVRVVVWPRTTRQSKVPAGTVTLSTPVAALVPTCWAEA